MPSSSKKRNTSRLSSRASKGKKKTDTQKVSMLYDASLPISLKKKGVETSKGFSIKPRTHQASPSPYIVHLSHEKEVAKPVSAAQRIDQLAKELVIDHAYEETVSEDEVNESLTITLDDLSAQLREPEVNISSSSLKIERAVIEHAVIEPSRAPVQAVQPIILFEQENVIAPVDEVIIIQEVEEERTKEPIRLRLPTISLPSFQNIAARLPGLLPTQVRHRAIASFVVLSMVAVLPLHAMQSIVNVTDTKDDITSIGTQAIDELSRGAHAVEAQRYDVAQSDFTRAGERFAEAQDSLQDMHLAVSALVNLIPQTDRTYETVRGLVVAGKELSTAASLFAQAADDLANKDSITLTSKINLLSAYIASVQPHVQLAREALENVDPTLVPDDQQERVTELLLTVPQLEESVKEFLTFSETLVLILGDEQKMRYLVSFQNNTELRATGGFTGSFAEMDLLNGEVESVYIPEGGTYDLQGQLSSFVEPPQPLSLLNSRWEFHDANWFPDFGASASKMIDLYTDAGGPTVDGMVAVNATLLPKLLEITGPIEMPEYGRTIDAENFLFETQKIVEYEYEQYQGVDGREEDAPKQFIGDLAPKVLELLAQGDMETLLSVADVLGSALNEKDIQVYFQDNDIQREIEALGWSGSMKQTSGDYLMVVNTNLGGGKTDSVIGQDIIVDIDITEAGEIINTVTITKEHHGLRDAIFEGANNVDYLRLYVPNGSELIEASGFEVPPSDLFETSEFLLNQDEDLELMTAGFWHDPEYDVDVWQESGKTVFGSWMQTAPGEIETVTFRYKLPWTVDLSSPNDLLSAAKERLGLRDLESYSLLLQKQSGVETRNTSVFLHLPESMNLLWSSHEGLRTDGVDLTNKQDVFVHFLMER
ncbi:DUF4012 domain-containing protein [Candidatus Uhrbacteria bacterium]|jgi:hypothetical protein|nr:DUF4012 domain-containing protein [Candidatus Uhrbacteria bacterium]